MKKFSLGALLAIAFLPLVGRAADSEFPISFESITEMEKPFKTTTHSKLWYLDSRTRRKEAEVTVAGEPIQSIEIVKGGKIYLLNPKQKTVKVAPWKTTYPRPETHIISRMELNGMKPVSSVKVEGEECEVYADAGTAMPRKLWVRKSDRRLIREMIQGTHPTDYLYQNIKSGPIDPKLFEIPADYEKIDLSKAQ